MQSFSRTFKLFFNILFFMVFLQIFIAPMTSEAAWVEDTSWKYVNEDGSFKVDEWFTDSAGKTYYLDEDGSMTIGWLDVPSEDAENGVTSYFFDYNGVMVRGLCEIDDRLYLFNEDGSLFSGAKEIEGISLSFGREGAEIPEALSGQFGSYDQNGNIQREAGEYRRDDIGYILIYLIFIVGAAGFIFINRKKRALEVSVIVIAVLMSSLPLFLRYIIYGHDLTFQLNRILGINESLRHGMFPVRLNGYSFNGYGYADAVFYPNLFMYIPAVLFGLGVNFTSAVHIFLLMVNAGSALSMYYCGKKLFSSERIGCISSILYTLAVYRLCNEYTRAAYGELLAMVFLPLAIYGLYELFYGNEDKWPLLVSAFTGIFQSHLISTVLTAAGCLIFGLISIRRLFDKKRLTALIKVMVFTVLLNLWTLIPLIQYMLSGIDTSALQFSAEDKSAPISLFFSIFPSATGSSPSPIEDLSRSMPMALGAGLLIGIFLMLICWREIRKLSGFKIARALFLSGIILIFVSSSLFPWDYLVHIDLIKTASSYIQFPWRLQTYGTCFLALSGAFVFSHVLDGKKSIYVYGIPFLLALLSSQFYIDQILHTEAYIWSENDVTSAVGKSEYLYAGTDPNAATGEAHAEGVVITGMDKDGFSITLNYEPGDKQTGSYIEVPLFYYPNYRAYDENNNELPIERGNSNVIRIPIADGDDGSGWMHIYYKEPLLWRAMEAISAASFMGLTIYGVLIYMKRRRAANIRE